MGATDTRSYRGAKRMLNVCKWADRIKLLLWDGTGLVLVTKRLQSGTFRWPRFGDGVMSLAAGPAHCGGRTGCGNPGDVRASPDRHTPRAPARPIARVGRRRDQAAPMARLCRFDRTRRRVVGRGRRGRLGLGGPFVPAHRGKLKSCNRIGGPITMSPSAMTKSTEPLARMCAHWLAAMRTSINLPTSAWLRF